MILGFSAIFISIIGNLNSKLKREIFEILYLDLSYENLDLSNKLE
jgi:hypothetical protein